MQNKKDAPSTLISDGKDIYIVVQIPQEVFDTTEALFAQPGNIFHGRACYWISLNQDCLVGMVCKGSEEGHDHLCVLVETIPVNDARVPEQMRKDLLANLANAPSPGPGLPAVVVSDHNGGVDLKYFAALALIETHSTTVADPSELN